MERQNALPDVIGLCLSGGGFRAAAFHLGTLIYLDSVGWLERVRQLSTVSGGTFTGAKYAVARVEKKPLARFFAEYFDELRTSRVFPRALELLAKADAATNVSGQKNIIVCAAHSYSTTLFAQPGGTDPYWFSQLLEGDTGPLDEITFNATDFRTGLAFRFQKSKTGGLIGNLKDHIDRQDAGRLRLGDIVAASSCFPGGFEPFEFPRDFTWKGGLPEEVRKNFPRPSPLMDGGVYDNQGLDSLLYAEVRAKRPSDVLIISDTDRKEDELYGVPRSISESVGDPSQDGSWALRSLLTWNPTLATLDWLSRLLLWLSGLSSVALVWHVLAELSSALGSAWHWVLLTGIVPLVTTSTAFLMLLILRGAIRSRLLVKIPQLQAEGWQFLRHVRLARAIDMCTARLSSLLALTSGIFMKRIRSSSLDRTFDDPAHRGRLMANLIYSLRPRSSWIFENPEKDDKMLEGLSPELIRELKAIPPPSESLRKVAEEAATVPTLLWFQDEKEQLRTLVAAGQFTTCFNLLKYLARTRVFDSVNRSFANPEVHTLWTQLLSDWKKVCDDPHSLLSEKGEQFK